MSPRCAVQAAGWSVAGLALALLAAGCVSPPTTGAMQAAAPVTSIATAPGSMAVRVTGGRATSELEGPNITAADFKAAAEATLLGSRAFTGLAEPDQARYVLLRKGIVSTGTATTNDAMAGATRIRLAIEAAARANLQQLLPLLGAVAY